MEKEKATTEKSLEIPSEIKGVILTVEQKAALSKGEKVPMSGMQRKGGGTFSALVSWDLEKAKPRYDFPEKPDQAQEFRMPNKIKGVELSEENKQKLAAGEKVFLAGMTAVNGKLFDAHVYVDKEKGTLAFDFPEKKENKQEQKEAPRETPLAKPIKKNVVKM